MSVKTYYSQSRMGYNDLCDKHMPFTNDEALELMDLEFVCETTQTCSVCECE
jgi:hypothetical protein